jgi:hypothetical protein
MDRMQQPTPREAIGCTIDAGQDGRTEILDIIADGQEAKTGILAYGPEGRITALSRAWG